MRPQNQAARDRLPALLGRLGPVSAPDLAEALQVSVPTVRRMLAELGPDVVGAGQARRRRYALRRALRGRLAPLNVYALNEADGAIQPLGELALRQPQGCHFHAPSATWPSTPGEHADGWWEGLPYMLQDMRPQGYMGRQFARQHHTALELDPDPNRWSDVDTLVALSRAGTDLPGNLIVGDVALAQWQALRTQGLSLVPARQLGERYVQLAEQAIASGFAGSSAAGEFPKFTAPRELAGARTPHVIVKFSGADRSPAVQRWADLLVCEHLALQALGALTGISVASSRIVQHAGRTFLESERFDRHGHWGRSAVVSLSTLDACFIGTRHPGWPELARRLSELGWLHAQQVQQVSLIWWFGRLIGNTDMHTGNLSFVPHQGRLQLAPAYDMLPMMYAPLPGGELAQRTLDPPWAPPGQQDAWRPAGEAALSFWQAAAHDGRISEAFRAHCAVNASRLMALLSSAI